jgi:hypothetical protein
MREAAINAKQSGERGINAKNIKKVTEVSVTNGPLWDKDFC